MPNNPSLSTFINNLQTQAQTLDNWELNESIEQMRSTYYYMLSFLVKGVEDPNAKQLGQQLWTQAQATGQRIRRIKYLKEKPNSRYSIALLTLRSDSELGNLLMRLEVPCEPAELEDCMVKLFRRIWTSDQWQNGDYEVAMQILDSGQVPPKAKAVLISAVVLALMEFFDERKLTLLLDAYLNEDNEVSQRALVGIVLSLRKDHELLSYYPEITSRLDILGDDEAFTQYIYTILMQLQISTMTDKITSKMREDIMPNIVKGSRMMKQRMGLVELGNKLSENGENPEWLPTTDTDDSKAEEKVREMVEMQLEGEDIYMATFAMMKGYRFFGEMAHWFYPFTDDDIALQNMQQNFGSKSGDFMRALLAGSPFCNSDKYSLCLLTSTLGQQGFESIAAQVEAQMSDLDQDELNEALSKSINRKKKLKEYSRHFIFDLYRFFYIYGFRSEFYNPFADGKKNIFSPESIPALPSLTENKPLLLEHAEFLMRKGYYEQALSEFLLYMQTEEHTAELFQKIGFCYQKTEQWAEAQKYYERADSIKADSKWTLSHLGRVCIMQGDYATAQDCYEQICQMEPENVGYLLRWAECLKETGQTADAIDILHKANYLEPDSQKVRRLLGTCLILNKEYEKGLSFLDTPLARGMAYIIGGNPTKAYAQLKKAYAELNSPTTFAQNFNEEAQPYYKAAILTPQVAELYFDAVLFNV